MFVPAVMDRRYALQARQAGKPYNLPAPTGGINARDAFTDMDEHDAVNLVNVFPEANDVVVRGGYASWATNMTNPVRSLLVWNGLTGNDKLFAGAGLTLWDVTASGPATSSLSGLTNVDFQWTNLENAGGQFLIAVNGADSIRVFNGTSWSQPGISGTDASKFIQVTQFKERLWFAPINSLDLWYLDIQAIAGTATNFPLGAVFRRGGYICGLGSFSNDAGEGPDDYFSILTSNGEIAVYQGTDPNNANTWSLVGIFDTGKPIGRRSMIRWNGDLAILTQDGIVSMQAVLRFDRSSIQKASITGKIQTLFSQLAGSYKNNFGWMQCLFPKSRYLVVNIPQIEDMTQIQLVMNTITGSWTQFKGWSGGCFAMANDFLYFGGNDGIVYQAAVGNLDNGGVIPWELQTAWQEPGGATNKQFTAVRPTLLVGTGVMYAIGVDVDFAVSAPTGMLSALVPTAGTTVWNWTWNATWGGATVIDQRWQTAGAFGTWASIHMVGSVQGGSLQLNAFDVIAVPGGPY